MFSFEKMARYLLLLIQWAVSSRACSVQITTGATRLTFEHDGVWAPESPYVLRAAELLEPLCGRVVLAGPSGVLRLFKGSRAPRSQTLPVTFEMDQSLHLVGLIASLAGSKQIAFQETRLAEVDARFCSIPIAFHDKILNSHEWLALQSVMDYAATLPQRTPDKLVALPGSGMTVRIEGSPVCCRGVVGSYPSFQARSHVYFLQHGVIVGEAYPDLGQPPQVAYLAAPELTVLPGGYGVARDAAYHRLLGQLGSASERTFTGFTRPEPPAASVPEPMGYLLEELRGGTVESQGSFTVDFLAARRKLSQYQLSDPALYLTWMAQTALAAGATDLRAYRDGRTACLESEVDFLPADLADQLLTAILKPTAGPLRPFAIGLNTVLDQDPSRVVIERPDGTWLHYKPGELVTGGGARGGRTRVSVRHRRSGDAHAAVKALQARSRLCPHPLRLARPIELRWPFPSLLGDFVVGTAPEVRVPPATASFRLVAGESLLDPYRTNRRAEKWPSHAEALLALRATPSVQSTVRFLRHGLEVAEQPVDLPFPGVMAWLSCDGLKLDLSEQQVVQDAAFRERMGWLAERAETLWIFARRYLLHESHHPAATFTAWYELLDESVRPVR